MLHLRYKIITKSALKMDKQKTETTFALTQDRLGISNAEAAKACDTSERTIRRWRASNSPVYAIIILENIHLFLNSKVA